MWKFSYIPKKDTCTHCDQCTQNSRGLYHQKREIHYYKNQTTTKRSWICSRMYGNKWKDVQEWEQQPPVLHFRFRKKLSLSLFSTHRLCFMRDRCGCTTWGSKILVTIIRGICVFGKRQREKEETMRLLLVCMHSFNQ